MKIIASPPEFTSITQDLLAVFHFEDKDSDSLTALKSANAGLIDGLIESKVIKSATGSVTPLFGHSDLPAKLVLVIGCGQSDKFTESVFVKTLQTLAAEAQKAAAAAIALPIDDIKPAQRTAQWCVEKATELVLTSLYKYDTTKSKKNDPSSLHELAFLAAEQNLDLAIKTGKSMAHGINVCRELGNLPANICDPAFLAEQATELADACDEIDVEIVEEAEMEKLGMGAFLAVSRGSEKAGKIIVMKYNGGQPDQAPHVLVGKGLTFDSGGISLKPAAGMEEMKWDMLGAASVMGVMNTLAELRPNLNVIGVIAAAENMINGAATRPGDVVTCMNGKTVEIINTDAEGRLVLCDTLSYVEKFKPASVIDIATLTGAIVIGLGHHATAVYANNETLQDNLISAGKATWDRGWPMPLWDEYKPYLESPYADMKNVGGRAGGSITAAMYLSEFTQGYDWAHLDIAGVGWETAKAGPTGRPVAMLTQYLLDRIQ
ncbi:leucyl aminopeptidase [Reinekea blandensis]|uniref:Probable cytosol aminopeptidase n=1 Tax=Reinekea blandensis MED297 TaxID=314283 RepID=A4BBY4_9GAMM|nr:leucyl aminopeptidase [Reinekea blandensis]EAR10469.1 Leucyl aminopeptidase [Reinekea sp. MED297] [Reinekea blandensis MED297]